MSGPIDEMDWKTFILATVVPSVGSVIASLTFLSPLAAVIKIQENKSLGDFNPTPLVTILANCLVWIIYGCFDNNPYMLSANIPGLMFGLYMTLTCYGFADEVSRIRMKWALLFFATIILSVSSFVSLLGDQLEDRTAILGFTGVGILMCFYAAPLTAVSEVIQTQSSAKLYWPSCAMGMINGLLWASYGLAIGDYFIGLPNLAGAFLSLLQLVLVFIYPNKSSGSVLEETVPLVDGQNEDA